MPRALVEPLEPLERRCAAPRRAGTTWLMIVLVFALHLSVYCLNGDFEPSRDVEFSTYLPVLVLTRGSLAVTPTGTPALFVWIRKTPRGEVSLPLTRWDQPIDGLSPGQLRQRGELYYVPRYCVTRSVRHDRKTGEPLYVNTFGPGPGLLALPVFAVLHAGVGDLSARPLVMWRGAKFVAAMLVAGSVVFVFLTAARFTTRRRALLVAMAYGMGTCVWSISSQGLWQHGPNEFFIAMGIYFLVRVPENRGFAAACGLALALAVVCRPTSALIVIAIGSNLSRYGRVVLLAYCLAGAPVALALGGYNAFYHGSPTSFGQADVGPRIALQKTGSSDVWQTPLLTGATGLLLSPSRGLLVFSPFLLFALVGLVPIWSEERYATLRPLTVAIALLVALASKWYDWWGGWCFGYRPIVDTMPLFAALLVPAIDQIVRRKAVWFCFSIALAWSVIVQFVGAFAYDLRGWNDRLVGYEFRLPGRLVPIVLTDPAAVRLAAASPGARARALRTDIDRPEYRARLWSIRDSQLVYSFSHFAAARARKHAAMAALGRSSL